ncbi:MAG: hypothetical protein ABFC96_11490, partial [Thermoguttaceae bacterium]
MHRHYYCGAVLLALLAIAGTSVPVAAAGASGETPNREVRAIWCSPCTGAYPGDWDRSAKLLAGNGY